LSPEQAPTFSGPHRPAALRFANAIGGVLGTLGLSPRLTLPALIRASGVRHAHLDEAGDAAFCDRLQTLLDDANGAARLSSVGRRVIHERFANLLGNRLRVRQWLREHPRTLDVPVEQPLFVVGAPRTGSTLLYRLLAQDPQARAPRLWEINAPVPPPVPDAQRGDPRFARCERELARIHKFLPALAIAHDLRAGEPDECFPLLETSALSPTFILYFHIAKYKARLESASPAEIRDGYANFRHQVQILLMRSEGRRWLGKSPAHLFFLDALADAFPDGGIVMTHRDPVESIPSLASLIAIIRSVSSDHVEPKEVGRATLDWFVESARRLAAARASIAPARVVDVTYARLVCDPVGAVREIYAHFDLPLTRLFERRMSDWLAANPQHKRGVHRYALEQFGLDRDQVAAATQTYRSRYLA
jgi:hypothetical protein